PSKTSMRLLQVGQRYSPLVPDLEDSSRRRKPAPQSAHITSSFFIHSPYQSTSSTDEQDDCSQSITPIAGTISHNVSCFMMPVYGAGSAPVAIRRVTRRGRPRPKYADSAAAKKQIWTTLTLT